MENKMTSAFGAARSPNEEILALYNAELAHSWLHRLPPLATSTLRPRATTAAAKKMTIAAFAVVITVHALDVWIQLRVITIPTPSGVMAYAFILKSCGVQIHFVTTV